MRCYLSSEKKQNGPHEQNVPTRVPNGVDLRRPFDEVNVRRTATHCSVRAVDEVRSAEMGPGSAVDGLAR